MSSAAIQEHNAHEISKKLGHHMNSIDSKYIGNDMILVHVECRDCSTFYEYEYNTQTYDTPGVYGNALEIECGKIARLN